MHSGYATLHHFQRHRHVAGLEALAESALLQLESEAQTALREAAENFPCASPLLQLSHASYFSTPPTCTRVPL